MLNLSNKKKYTQNKINLTFRNNEEEEELYNWVVKKGKVGGMTNFIKIALMRMKLEEENNNK